MVKSKDDGTFSVAPFLNKCYDMVDDESTDAIISWSRNGVNSFVIWDMTEFSVRLLPKYFKHSNFSSFIRQLNIYGFRKIDADNWEFSNDGFIRGQKHLLKSITRRKNIQGVEPRPRKQESLPEFPGKLENSELWRQVEHLKADKNSLMQELIKLRQYQETADSKLLLLKNRLNGMEEDQQQMLSFLVLVMQSPNLLVQLLKPNEKNWRMAEDCQKKSGTIVEEINEEFEALPSNRSLVMYQRPADGTPISPEDCQDLDKGMFSSDAKMDFVKNIDLMKIFVDENANAPLIMPDLYDDGAWEKLLLASPSRTRTVDGRVEGQRFGGEEEENEETRETEPTGMGTESDKKRAFELLLQEMEKSDDDFEVENLDSEKSRSLQVLTEQMGLLASNEQLY